jgi:hypothetical protein
MTKQSHIRLLWRTTFEWYIHQGVDTERAAQLADLAVRLFVANESV